jgi:hypothetical protein
MRLKSPHDLLAAVDGPEIQTPRELLLPPSVKHGPKQSLGGVIGGRRTDQVQSSSFNSWRFPGHQGNLPAIASDARFSH